MTLELLYISLAGLILCVISVGIYLFIRRRKQLKVLSLYGLDVGDAIIITGCADSSYNGTKEITSIDGDTMESIKFSFVGRLFRRFKRAILRKQRKRNNEN